MTEAGCSVVSVIHGKNRVYVGCCWAVHRMTARPWPTRALFRYGCWWTNDSLVCISAPMATVYAALDTVCHRNLAGSGRNITGVTLAFFGCGSYAFLLDFNGIIMGKHFCGSRLGRNTFGTERETNYCRAQLIYHYTRHILCK